MKFRGILTKLAERLDLPPDIAAGLPRIELDGFSACSLDRHSGILAYDREHIVIALNIGALTRGVVTLNADAQARSDIMNGDYSFLFDITTTPLAKSLTAIVNWTDEGFVTYFESVGD